MGACCVSQKNEQISRDNRLPSLKQQKISDSHISKRQSVLNSQTFSTPLQLESILPRLSLHHTLNQGVPNTENPHNALPPITEKDDDSVKEIKTSNRNNNNNILNTYNNEINQNNLISDIHTFQINEVEEQNPNTINTKTKKNTNTTKEQILDSNMIRLIKTQKHFKEGHNFKFKGKGRFFKKGNYRDSEFESEKALTSSVSDNQQEKQDINKVKGYLNDFFLTKGFHDIIKSKILYNMKLTYFQKNEIVTIEKTEGIHFFFIYKGTVSFFKNNIHQYDKESGSYFGLRSLVCPENRDHTAICTEDNTHILSISQDHFLITIWELSKRNYAFVRDTLLLSTLFNILNSDMKDIVVTLSCIIGSLENYPDFLRDVDVKNTLNNKPFKFLSYEKDEVVVDPEKNKNLESSIYLILSGKVQVHGVKIFPEETVTSDHEARNSYFNPKDDDDDDDDNDDSENHDHKNHQNDDDENSDDLNRNNENTISNQALRCFGEDTFLLKQPFNYKVTAVESQLKVIKISPILFHLLYGEKYLNSIYFSIIKSLFMTNKELECISEQLLFKMYHQLKIFKHHKYKNGDLVLKLQSITDKIIICLSGYLYTSKSAQIVSQDYKLILSKDIKKNKLIHSNEDVLASDNCFIITCNFYDIEKYLDCRIFALKRTSMLISVLSKCNYFSLLNPDKLKIIAERINKSVFNIDDVIIKEEEILDKFYLIKKGSITIYKKESYGKLEDRSIVTVNQRKCARKSIHIVDNLSQKLILYDRESYGIKNLLIQEKSTVKMVSNEQSEIYVLKAHDFQRVIETSLKEYITNIMYLCDPNIEISDLYYIGILNRWDFGDILLVKNIRNNLLYSMKQYRNSKIHDPKIQKMIEQEKSILSDITHPFMIKYVKCLKHTNSIFFLNEYVQGVQLNDFLMENTTFGVEVTQFFVACVVEMCDFIHKKSVACRNISINSFIVDSKGFLKLNEFGVFKEIPDKTNTVIGSFHYMCPEMVKGEGYSLWVDIWSIGILAYHLFTGDVPFGKDKTSQYEVYESIINEDIMRYLDQRFDAHKDMKSFILDCLNKNLSRRLTSTHRAKNHIWLKFFTWDNLVCLNMTPPIKPKINKNPLYTENTQHLTTYLSSLSSSSSHKSDKTLNSEDDKFNEWFNNF